MIRRILAVLLFYGLTCIVGEPSLVYDPQDDARATLFMTKKLHKEDPAVESAWERQLDPVEYPQYFAVIAAPSASNSSEAS